MKHDDVYIKHIFEAAGELSEFVKGMNKKGFLDNKMARAAAVRQIQIIGDATKLISDATKSQFKDIPWKDITGMRDKIVHDYFGVDYESVWTTATVDVPELVNKLRENLK
jgi:uncharacterized protein with HEPN domain